MAYTKSGRVKGQVSLSGGKGAKNTSLRNPNTVSTVGIKAKVTKNVARPTVHGSNQLRSTPKKGAGEATRTGTTGSRGGGRGIVKPTFKAVKTSNSIPSVIRRAASRGPSNGSNKPSFTSKVVKITSK